MEKTGKKCMCVGVIVFVCVYVHACACVYVCVCMHAHVCMYVWACTALLTSALLIRQGEGEDSS